MNLLSEIKVLLQQGHELSAISAAASVSRSMKNSAQLHELERALKPVSSSTWDQWCQRSIKILCLSGETFQHLAKTMKFAFKLERINAEIHFSEYHLTTDALHPSSEFIQFKPDYVLLHPTHQEISQWPELSLDSESYFADLKAQVEHWKKLAETTHSNFNCQVILDLFAPYPFSSLATGEWRCFGGSHRFIEDLNANLRTQSITGTQIHSIDRLVRQVGENLFWDHRMWVQAKISMSTVGADAYCKSIARNIGASLGLSKKCLVLDLDNTLWGGVIGDVGVEGIQIGTTSAEGEAYSRFQTYISSLKKHGVLLAVCSKNEETNAKEPFLVSQDLPLKLDDIDVFIANWSAKSQNLAQIAKSLNIGIDALVFFDDNPAERMEVITHAPQVYTVDAPEDPADYIAALDRCVLFELIQPTTEDFMRAKQYEQQRERSKLELSSGDYSSFLQSLSMQAQIQGFTPNDMNRISQLINKTNQFNVTTRRYTEADCESWMNNKDAFTLTVRLKDRFGDHGLIAVCMGEKKENSIHIDTWLMSCRVLKRGVEELVMEQIIQWANTHKIEHIKGEYLPTKKNGLVADLYSKLGFQKIDESSKGSLWQLSAPFQLPTHYIKASC